MTSKVLIPYTVDNGSTSLKIQCISFEEKLDTTVLRFSIDRLSKFESSPNHHAITCPYELGDEDMISCKQLIQLVKEELLQKIRTSINEEVLAKIGKQNYQNFKNCELHQRTHKYLRAMQSIA